MFTDPTVQTLIVAGGTNGRHLDTTELLRPGASAWQFAAALPRKMSSLRGANIGGSFYLTGGWDGSGLRNGESSLPVCTSLLTFPLQRFSTTTSESQSHCPESQIQICEIFPRFFFLKIPI